MTETNAIGHPILKPKTPVPSDIQVSKDIVKEVGLLDIATLAKEWVSENMFFFSQGKELLFLQNALVHSDSIVPCAFV